MDMTIVIAAVAALAILLIAFGVAMSGGSSDVNARLARYASTREEKPEAAGGSQGIAQALQSSEALAQLNKVVEQRDFGANLAREIARADLRLKPSEYLVIWAATTIGVPLADAHAVGRAAHARQPAVPHRRAADRVHAAALLARPQEVGPPQVVQQAAARHDHPDRQRPPGGVLVPPGRRARRARVPAADLHGVRPRHPRGQPRPAHSRWPWRTWSAVCAPTTWS